VASATPAAEEDVVNTWKLPRPEITRSAQKRIRSHSSALAAISLVLISLAQPRPLTAQSSDPESGDPRGPLLVTHETHVVVMQYEAWFGPNAVTFQTSAAIPLLQSEDMQSIGGGYDSADPAIIKHHVAWMESLGMDAALIEVTNNVSCIFNSEAFAEKYLPNCSPAFRLQNQTIRDNTGNLYPAWSKLETRLKLIPPRRH
jgi:hypothetical protein